MTNERLYSRKSASIDLIDEGIRSDEIFRSTEAIGLWVDCVGVPSTHFIRRLEIVLARSTRRLSSK